MVKSGKVRGITKVIHPPMNVFSKFHSSSIHNAVVVGTSHCGSNCWTRKTDQPQVVQKERIHTSGFQKQATKLFA